MDADRLDRARKVYVDANGTSKVRDEELPVAFFDSDSTGRETMKSLRESLYAGEPDLVLEVQTFTGMAGSEVEDLIPAAVIIRQLDRWQRAASVPFADEYKPGASIVPQIEAWATKHGVTLAKLGWKAELAKKVKQQLLTDGHGAIDSAVLERWIYASAHPRGTVPVLSLLGVVGVHSVGRGEAGSR